MSGTIRVLLVDDSLTTRGILGRYIDSEPDLDVVGVATNGRQAVDQVIALDPDVVVLDLEMPVMTGVEALQELRSLRPTLPVIVFSVLTDTGAAGAVDALALGAADYSTKPVGMTSPQVAMEHVQQDLIPKIRAVSSGRRPSAAPRPTETRPRPAAASVKAIVLASSTGGPVALEQVLTSIRRPLPLPIFIVQHLPASFTEAFAQRLDRNVASRVVEAEHGVRAEPGTCYIAPGGRHMSVQGKNHTNVFITVRDGEPIHSCKPSAEPLFESAADVYRTSVAAVVLTGMGNDGIDGCHRIGGLGGHVIVQDEATSVVWGMPGAVARAGLATQILPLDEIGPAMTRLADAAVVAR